MPNMKMNYVAGSVPVDKAQRIYIPASIRKDMGWDKEEQNPFIFVDGILIFYPMNRQELMLELVEKIQADTAKKLEEENNERNR